MVLGVVRQEANGLGCSMVYAETNRPSDTIELKLEQHMNTMRSQAAPLTFHNHPLQRAAPQRQASLPAWWVAP